MQKALPRSTCLAQGVNPTAILAFANEIVKASLEVHGIMVLRHGHVVAEGWWKPYGPDKPHMLFSLSKSFVSTAVGFAVTEGLLTVDDPVIKFFPAYADLPGKHWQELKVKHLLTMSTGHKVDTTGFMQHRRDGDWIDAFFQRPLVFQPGTHFLYNSGASYLLSVIVQNLTGQRVLDYLQPRLLQPLGIKQATWDQSPQGYDVGGWGLNLCLEDVAIFGQFLLQRGLWKGKQLLPVAWIDEATAKQIDNGSNPDSDWDYGYGYQFWRNSAGGYRADGAFGQYSFVFPDEDVVIAMNCGTDHEKQAVMKLVWKMLHDMLSGKPENTGAQSAMQERLAGLEYAPPQGSSPEDEAALNERAFTLERNRHSLKSVAFQFENDGCRVAQTTTKGKFAITFGHSHWAEGIADMGNGPTTVAAAYGWDADGTLVLVSRLVNTPYTLTWRVKQEDGGISLQVRHSTDDGTKPNPSIHGTVKTK